MKCRSDFEKFSLCKREMPFSVCFLEKDLEPLKTVDIDQMALPIDFGVAG